MTDLLSTARDTPDRTGSERQTEQWRSSSEPPSGYYHYLFSLSWLPGLCSLILFRQNIPFGHHPAITGIQSVNHLTNSDIDFLVRKNLLGRIHEEQVYPTLNRQQMLLPAPTLTDTALQKIALDCALEHLLRHRHHDTVRLSLSPGQTQIAQARHIAVLTFGKKP